MSFAKRFIGVENLDDTGAGRRQEVLAVAALEAAHLDDLADTARMWLHERRIVIPGPRRVPDWARVAFDATAADMAATIEAGLGKAALLKAVDGSYAPQDRMVGGQRPIGAIRSRELVAPTRPERELRALEQLPVPTGQRCQRQINRVELKRRSDCLVVRLKPYGVL